MNIEKTSGGFKVKTECKNYVFGGQSPLISQIEVGEKQLLAAPVRVVYRDGEQFFVLNNAEFFNVASENSVTLSSCAQSGLAVVNTVMNIEEDGLLDVTLSVMPEASTGMECFGVGEIKKRDFCLDKLYIEVPLNKKFVRFAHIFPIGRYVRDGVSVGNDSLRVADYLPEKELHCGFKQQVLIMGDDCGFGIFFESDRDIVYGDKGKFFEIINEEDAYLLRVRLIDAVPDQWRVPEKYLLDSDAWKTHVFPLSFRFGMQTLPVRKWDYSKVLERNLHMSAYEKTPDGDYENYMWEPVKEWGGESRMQRLERFGVKVLYIHESWDDFQNSPILNEASEKRLKKIVTYCHERGIKVVPYFGYEISTLSPLFAKYGKKFLRVSEENKNLGWHYYRYPYQRDIPVCLNNEWKDIFFKGLADLQTEFGFDGFYLDGTVWPVICKNVEHGCGFYKDGELHGTHAVFAMREFMKNLYDFCSARNLIINVHPDGAINLATIAYCTSVWDGEFFQSRLLNGELDEVPEPLIRTQYSGACTGIPVYALYYVNPPTWRFRQAAALSLLCGTLPKVGYLDESIEYMSRIWDIFEQFIAQKAVFRPYYENNESAPVKVSGAPHVKLSYLETDSEILAIVSCVKKNISEKAVVTSIYPVITDAELEKELSLNGKVEFEFTDFDFKLLRIAKK